MSHLLPSTTLRPAPWWHRRLRQARSSPQRRRLVAGRACFRTRLRALRPATEKSPKLGRRLGLLDQRLEPGLGGANCHGERDQGEGDEERHRLSLPHSGGRYTTTSVLNASDSPWNKSSDSTRKGTATTMGSNSTRTRATFSSRISGNHSPIRGAIGSCDRRY